MYEPTQIEVMRIMIDHEALNALEAVAGEFRADPAWSPMLLDGPRVLGVESLAFSGSTVRLQVRTAPTRQDYVARELRRGLTDRDHVLDQRGRYLSVGTHWHGD